MTTAPIEFTTLEILARGSVIASVGILLYIWQTKSKTREDKRDMARILRNEVRRVLDIMPNRERERIVSDKFDRLPDSRVSAGLLQTGNIRFFNDYLLDELYEWYSFIDDFHFEVDVDARINLVWDLEHMEQKNRKYRKGFVGRLTRS